MNTYNYKLLYSLKVIYLKIISVEVFQEFFTCRKKLKINILIMF